MAGETLSVVRDGTGRGMIELRDELVIGRGEPGPFADDAEISRRHARITRTQTDQLILEDLGSTNGTYLNGWRIPSPQVLSHGDKLQLGRTYLLVAMPGGSQRRSVIIRGSGVRPARSEAVLYVEGLSKSYGERQVLKSVDLEVMPGEILGLLGHNGAGKSTTISIIAGLREASAGQAWVNGVDALKDSQAARRFHGVAPQDLGIYTTLTVRRNLRFFGELAGLRGKLLDERVEEIASALSLTPLLERPAGQMSGGEKRRLHTGMAMLHHPKLLILDEPTVGADVRTRAEILNVVKRLAAEGRAVVYSTHYMPEIEELGASVAILQGGEIIARGSIAELISRHSETAVELRFDGTPPALPGYDARVDGSLLRISTDEPTETAASAIASLGSDMARLRGVEVIRPSLESVYLKLTGEHYAGPEEAEDDGDATLRGEGRLSDVWKVDVGVHGPPVGRP